MVKRLVALAALGILCVAASAQERPKPTVRIIPSFVSKQLSGFEAIFPHNSPVDVWVAVYKMLAIRDVQISVANRDAGLLCCTWGQKHFDFLITVGPDGTVLFWGEELTFGGAKGRADQLVAWVSEWLPAQSSK